MNTATGAQKALKELLKVPGVIFVRVHVPDPIETVIHGVEDRPVRVTDYKGGTNTVDYDLNIMLNDATVAAVAMRKIADSNLDVRFGGYHVTTEAWPNMYVAVAIAVGHPSNKSLKRKLRRVAKKCDPEVESPGASASAAPVADRPSEARLH